MTFLRMREKKVPRYEKLRDETRKDAIERQINLYFELVIKLLKRFKMLLYRFTQ